MIFRINAGVENVLALTPVLAEWKRRNKSLLMVETRYPELLEGNECIDEVAKSIGSDDNYVELDYVRWPLVVKNVTLGYAEKILGDTNMECWRTTMASLGEEIEEARRVRPSGRVAAVAFGLEEIDGGMVERIMGVVSSAGYSVFDVGRESSLRVRRAMISVSDLFVGVDGPTSSLAYTTDVPAVVIHTWRDPCYFWPFRRDIPFVAVTPSEKDCSIGRICLANNGLTEFGKVYGCRCSMEQKFKCRKIDFDIMVGKALENMSLVA